MQKVVVLSWGSGSLQSGFSSVTVKIGEFNNLYLQDDGSLPPAPNLKEIYPYWQFSYLAMHGKGDSYRVEIKESSLNNFSRLDFKSLCNKITAEINNWLNSESFRSIEQKLRTNLDADDEIQFVIETDDILLRRLPWHLWNFFDHYPKAEATLSSRQYQRVHKKNPSRFKTKVRILGILGDASGIDTTKDRIYIERLSKQASIKFLSEPRPEELYEQISKGWDILFFAGHSSSKESGLIQLNQTDSLSLDEISHALREAISNGLKLAVFNSCDGLGLAQALGDLQIPQVIVMREPVPDVVAQEFLKHFLAAFSSGQSLHLSVRDARQRLEKLQRKYPCATWLPVICQNPSEKAITWQELRGQATPSLVRNNRGEQQNRQFLFGGRWLQTILLVSAVTTGLVMGVRYLGIMQPWELQAEDQLMRWRSDELVDPRVIAITVTEEDLQLPQNLNRKGSLSDLALDLVLEKIDPILPKVEHIPKTIIGLDIYHDFPINQNKNNLAAHLQSPNFFGVCKFRDSAANHPGVSPPPNVVEGRQGFSDILPDPDKVIRRHLLSMRAEEASPCTTKQALSVRLAAAYLALYHNIKPAYNNLGEFKLGKVVFHPLHTHIGSYQGIELGAYQILLNYRSAHSSPNKAIRKFTLKEVLDDNRLTKEIIENSVILIGTNAPTFHDFVPTPYRDQGFVEEIPGVIFQAQMVSQILSAVLDNRPLLWFLPWWGEVTWVFGWSLAVGLVIWRLRSPLILSAPLAISLFVGLCGVACWLALWISGCWLPLVPPVIALVATSSVVIVFQQRNA